MPGQLRPANGNANAITIPGKGTHNMTSYETRTAKYSDQFALPLIHHL
jgi:hypothetical protein